MRKPKKKIYVENNYYFRWKPHLSKSKLRWKDKFGTPSIETSPYFIFEWLWFSISCFWEDADYWEQHLWIHKYHDGNEPKAIKEWGWTNFEGESTWEEYK